ncbi:hypothetical protein BaRGS_00023970 [Batillaria attramentaria]|uniref:Uncharacterized protein n=1 Tax=Batillaria attramentaria TaxID=370345 RepID=A0ABD0KCB1_9CAEN
MSRTDAPPGTSKTPGSGQTSSPSPDEEDERDAGDRQQQGAMLASSHSNDDRDDDDHSRQPTPYRHDTLETPPHRPRDSPHAARGAWDGHGQEDGAPAEQVGAVTGVTHVVTDRVTWHSP